MTVLPIAELVFATLLMICAPLTPGQADESAARAGGGELVTLAGEDLARVEDLEGRIDEVRNAGKYTEASELTEDVIEIRRRVLGDDHPDTLRSILALGDLLVHGGKSAEAEPLIDEALAGFRRTLGGEHEDTLAALDSKGVLLYSRGRYAEAEPLFREVLAARRLMLGDEQQDTLDSIMNLGSLLLKTGPLDESEQLHREALEGYRRVLGDEHPTTLIAINNMGSLLSARGRPVEAEPLYRETLAAKRRTLGDDHPGTLNSLNNLGLLLQDQGRLAEAEPLVRLALEGRRRVLGNDHPRTMSSINSLGTLFYRQGRWAEAEPLFREALDGYRRVLGDDHPGTLMAINNLGLLLRDQNRLPEAEPLLRESLESRRRVLGQENPLTLASINNMGYLLSAQGKSAEAEALYLEALTGYRRTLGNDHPDTLFAVSNLGFLLQRRGRFGDAEPLLREALAGRRRVLGNDHPQTVRSMNLLAFMMAAQGRYAEAEATLTESAGHYETARIRVSAGGLERVEFAAGLSPLVPLAACLARNGKPLPAWQRFEAGLARGLLDTLSARHTRPLNADERRREQELFRRLDQLDEELGTLCGSDEEPGKNSSRIQELGAGREKARLDLARFQAQLESRYGPAAGEVFSLDRIQARLPEDAAIVGWVDLDGDPHAADPGGEHWACVLRHRGKPVWVRLPGSGPDGAWTGADEELPDQLRRSLRQRPHGPEARRRLGLIRQLHAQRIVPLEPQLSGVSRLIVLPAGRMAGLPLEVLTEGRTVSYAPSGTMFTWLREKNRTGDGRSLARPDSLLALGDPLLPVPRGMSFAPLPGSRLEVEVVARLFTTESADARPVVLLAAEASEKRIEALSASGRLAGFRILHLATHGVMDEERAMQSALILSAPAPSKSLDQALEGRELFDGRLTGEQIVRTWKLDADLVTLSGCETGLGRDSGGEGYLGFAQALFVAGARSLVLSLWKVDDRATMLLMERFYRNLIGRYVEPRLLSGREYAPGTPLPKAEALTEAKQWLSEVTAGRLTERHPEPRVQGVQDSGSSSTAAAPPPTFRPYEDPHYWAAFVLIGDPD